MKKKSVLAYCGDSISCKCTFLHYGMNIYIYYYNSNLIRSAGSRKVDRHGSPDQTRRGASSLI